MNKLLKPGTRGQTTALFHRPQTCEICKQRPAALFIIVTQGLAWNKAHACWKCYDDILVYEGHLTLESVSLQEYKEFNGPQPIRPSETTAGAPRALGA